MAVNEFFWNGMSTRKRVSMIVGVVLILALSFLAFKWLTQDSYKALFTDLEARDASNVVAELEKMKVDYQLANNGTEILVPESVVHKVRIKLMGSNMPMVGGVGFEVFDDADFGMTEFVQRINYQRALEGELTRTIMALREVRYARVHLVMPEEGLFKQKDRPAQASVTLFTHQNQSIETKSILGMQRLVAASVPGLSPADVTITDQNGQILSQNNEGDPATLAASDRLKQKQAVEKYLVNKVTGLLARRFPDGEVSVSVDAQLDFSQVTSSKEQVLAPVGEGKGIVRRRESQNTGNDDSESGNVTTEVEYQLGRLTETRKELPGTISRLSVGVMVPAGIEPAQRQEIQNIVEMAVGFDVARGDAIAISSFQNHSEDRVEKIPHSTAVDTASLSSINGDHGFNAPAQENSPGTLVDPIEKWAQSRPSFLYGGLILGVLLLLALGALMGRRTRQITAQPRLSTAEREQLLIEVESWMRRDVPRANGAE